VALTKRFGRTVALDSLDLEVPSGVVFGYLGPNGAGKTTTLRLLMGLLRPTSGSVTVLGIDVQAEPTAVHRRVGYLPGDFVADPQMTAWEYLQYLGRLRGGVSEVAIDELVERFSLDRSRRIGTLSRGNRQKIGLVQAFMHHPDLLVLDEPTSGLDPLMQREFMALLGERRDAGATVVLSSHILTEVAEIAESVAIIRSGRLVVVDQVEALERRAARRIELDFAELPPNGVLEQVPGVRDVKVVGSMAHLVVEGSTDELVKVAAPYGVRNIVTHEADLEQIFLSFYGEEQRA
jgi:ABC-2 type transport system ATP-binding protein